MSRRGRGGGSTPRLRADGRWSASYYNREGKRRYVYGRTRREVQQKLRDELVRRDTGLSDDRVTVGGWIDRWLASLDPQRYRPNTVASYTYHLGLIPHWVRQLRLSDLEPDDIERMLSELAATHAASTVSHVRRTLGQCLGKAERYGKVARNAARLTDPVRSEEREVVPLDLGEARRLLAVLEGDRLQSLYTVALACGVRQSEAIGLRWDKVDLEDRSMLIDWQWTQLGEGPPKAKGSRRLVALPDVCMIALRAHRTRLLEERLQVGGGWEENGLVWPDELGRPLKHRNLRRHFHRAREAADLRHVRFHDLRHSAATLLLAQGVPAAVVMSVMGHTDPRMFLHYSKVSEELRRDAADAVDRAFSGRPGGRNGLH